MNELKRGYTYAVFSLKPNRRDPMRNYWIKAGWAFLKRDGSINVYLDVLPIDGKLQIRENFGEPAKPFPEDQTARIVELEEGLKKLAVQFKKYGGNDYDHASNEIEELLK